MQVLVRKFELEGNAKWILSRSELYLAQRLVRRHDERHRIGIGEKGELYLVGSCRRARMKNSNWRESWSWCAQLEYEGNAKWRESPPWKENSNGIEEERELYLDQELVR
jgi:hypothetical protein